jgi:peroxiredoxin
VLGVSVDDSPEDLRQFAAEYKMNYPVLVGLGHDAFQEKYDAGPDGSGHLVHQALTGPY